MVSSWKGLTWAGNIYRKFEDVCLEVDDLITKESYDYVQNRIQTAGTNVKQFCSGFIEEVLATSTTDSSEEEKPVDSSLVQNKESLPCENSTMNNTEHDKLELFEEVLATSSLDDSAKEPMNSSLVQNNGPLSCENSTMNDSNHAKLEFIEEVLDASSLDSAKHMDSSLVQTNESLPCENSCLNSERTKLEFIEMLVASSVEDSAKEPVDSSLVQNIKSLPCENSTMNNIVVAIRVENNLEVDIMENPIEEKQSLSQVSKKEVVASVEEAAPMEFNEISNDLSSEKEADMPSTEAIQLFDEYFTVVDSNEVNLKELLRKRRSTEVAFINILESLDDDFSDSEWEII